MEKIKDKLFTIGVAYSFTIVWVFLIVMLWRFLGIESSALPSLQPFSLRTFFLACIFAPLVETLVFQKAPMDIAKKLDPDLMVPMIILSSALFGWLHGGILRLPIQGVLGIGFAWVYIRNGYCYLSTVFYHFLWNASVIYMFRFL